MTTTLVTLTGKVHHAVGLVDGTACNGIGAARGQVRWYTRKGAVTCKACLKVIAKAHEEALRWDMAVFGDVQRTTPDTTPQPVRSAGSSTLPQAQRTPSGAPHVATPVVRTRKPQINHRACSHAATPYARRQCRNHAATLPTLAQVVDQAYQGTVDANLAQPYSDDEYARCDRVLKAALVVFANGDMDYANALRNLLLDSGEEIMYYVNTYSREENLEYVDRYTSFDI